MALKSLKKILSPKKSPKAKPRILTAEGWKRRFAKKNIASKKGSKA
jgi:hypothetical protein